MTYERELLERKKLELKDLENSQPIHIAKNDTPKSVARSQFDKEISMERPAQQKPGAVLQGNKRMTPKGIQKTPGLPLPSRTQSARV